MPEHSANGPHTRTSRLALALSAIAGIAALDLWLPLDLSPALTLPVLVVGAGGTAGAVVGTTALASLALFLGLHQEGGAGWTLRAAVGTAVLTAIGAMALFWNRRESRRLRVAVAAASCAADLLERNTGRLRALLYSTYDPLVLIDFDGQIHAASPSMQRVFGWSPQTLVGRPIFQLMPGIDLDPLRALPADSEAESGWGGELEGHHQSGRRFPCEVTAGRVATHKAEPNRDALFLLHLRDLTHRRTEELERLHSRKMQAIGQLAAGIAHEINTPTQYVGDNLRFLERCLEPLSELLQRTRAVLRAPECPDDAPHRELAGALERVHAFEDQGSEAILEALEGVERVASIVRGMRNFSHPGEGQHARIQLNRVIQDILTVSRHEWKQVARVETHLDPELPQVKALPGELSQVLLNLVVNAAHAIADRRVQSEKETAEPYGEIEIRTRRDGPYAEIRIRDTGTGIPEATLERIFEPFFTTKPVGRGTGQGLAIAHSVIQKYGGSIECTSRVNEGSVFVVRLPVDSEIPSEESDLSAGVRGVSEPHDRRAS